MPPPAAHSQSPVSEDPVCRDPRPRLGGGPRPRLGGGGSRPRLGGGRLRAITAFGLLSLLLLNAAALAAPTPLASLPLNRLDAPCIPTTLPAGPPRPMADPGPLLTVLEDGSLVFVTLAGDVFFRKEVELNKANRDTVSVQVRAVRWGRITSPRSASTTPRRRTATPGP